MIQEGNPVTLGSFLRKELGEALRNTERFWADCLVAPSR